MIREFIELETARQKEIADHLEDDHNRDWTALNRIFLEMINFDQTGDEKTEHF